MTLAILKPLTDKELRIFWSFVPLLYPQIFFFFLFSCFLFFYFLESLAEFSYSMPSLPSPHSLFYLSLPQILFFPIFTGIANTELNSFNAIGTVNERCFTIFFSMDFVTNFSCFFLNSLVITASQK